MCAMRPPLSPEKALERAARHVNAEIKLIGEFRVEVTEGGDIALQQRVPE